MDERRMPPICRADPSHCFVAVEGLAGCLRPQAVYGPPEAA
jgi:hypothetical protein